MGQCCQKKDSGKRYVPNLKDLPGFDRKNPAMVPPKKAKDAKKSNVVNRGGQPPAKPSIIAPSKATAKRSKNVKQNTVNKQKAKAVNKKVHSKNLV